MAQRKILKPVVQSVEEGNPSEVAHAAFIVANYKGEFSQPENAFDIRATSHLNSLYVELLKDNPDWGSTHRRHDMNHH